MRFEKLMTPSIMHKVGVGTYGRNEYDDEEKTPHYLMKRALEIYESRPLVNSGINQIVSFTTGHALVVESENEIDAKFVKEWKDARPNFNDEINKLVTLYYVCGNAYLEPSYTYKGDELVLDNVFCFFDPSKVYYNFEPGAQLENEYWVIELDPNIREIKSHNVTIHPRYRQWRTSPYSWFFKSNLWGAGVPKGNFFHLKQPYTRDGYYGFSFLQSVVDDAEVVNKIIRNMVAISNNKAIGKKLISVGTETDIVNEEDIDLITEKMNDSTYRNVLLNKKMTVEDLSYTGTYDTMIPEIEFLRKDISSGLVPNFITSYDNDTNKATAEQARVPFILNVEFHRKRIEEFINRHITQNLIKAYKLDPSTKLKFHKVDFYSINEKKDVYLDLYLNNIITFNEMRQFMELKPIDDGDKYLNDMNNKYSTQQGENQAIDETQPQK